MAFVNADRVKETSTTTGAGTYDLDGGVTGFRTFVAGIGTGNTCWYVATNGVDWEIGVGTVTDASPDTLARTTILSSSNAGAAVNWGAGTKTLFCGLPASKAKEAASQTVAGVVELAIAAEYRTGTDTARVPAIDQIWAAAAEVTLTDAATIAVGMSTFINAVVTLGGNRTLGNPTNAKVGQSGYIRVVQDATGSRTLSYETDWEFEQGSAPILSTAANAQDILFYLVVAANRVFATLVKAIS